jgi:BMFP domain-containing protein YqiC
LGVIDVMIRTREHGELAARVAELERRVIETGAIRE